MGVFTSQHLKSKAIAVGSWSINGYFNFGPNFHWICRPLFNSVLLPIVNQSAARDAGPRPQDVFDMFHGVLLWFLKNPIICQRKCLENSREWELHLYFWCGFQISSWTPTHPTHSGKRWQLPGCCHPQAIHKNGRGSKRTWSCCSPRGVRNLGNFTFSPGIFNPRKSTGKMAQNFHKEKKHRKGDLIEY